MKKTLFLGCISALLSLQACASNGVSEGEDLIIGGDVQSTDFQGDEDGEDRASRAPKFNANMAALNATFPGTAPMERIEDAYSARVIFGAEPGQSVVARSHLFGNKVNLIPYDNGSISHSGGTIIIDDTEPQGNVEGRWRIDDVAIPTADGKPAQIRENGADRNLRGDEILAGYFPPGQIGFAIKHHSPDGENRVLNLAQTAGAGLGALKEAVKLFDTHIELVIGVERPVDHDNNPATPAVNRPGVITLNNPQGYEGGRFGSSSYPMVFVEPTFPSYLSRARVNGGKVTEALEANIRTMMLGFNAVSEFPGDYNGGDPLAARNPAILRDHVANMVKAIGGDQEAVAWFRETENQIYCAELGFVSASAGMHFPLNAATFVDGGIVTADEWARFVEAVEKHNHGEETTFTTMNSNGLAYLVKGQIANNALRPSWSYAAAGDQAAQQQLLAFMPLTMADIVEEFIRTYVPREQLGESIAPVQGALFTGMRSGLFEQMGIDSLPAEHPSVVAVSGLYDQITQVISQPYADYNTFRATVAPYLAQARAVTGPRGDTGEGLFTPPSLLHIVAQGRRNGLLGLKYVGHGIHYSHVVPR